MRYRRHRYAGFSGLRGLGGFLPRMGQIKTFAVAGIAGAAGVAASTQIVRRVMNKLDPNGKVPIWGRELIAMGLGLVGATFLSKWNRDVAVGFAAGVVGFSLASMALRPLEQPVSFGGLRGVRGLRGLRGASITTHRPGRPQLGPASRPSPMAGMVITQRKVPAYLS